MTEPYPTDPLQAAAHANPYPYYAELRKEARVFKDATTGLWVVARHDTVHAVLGDARLTVRPSTEPVPRAIAGQPAGEVFARLARMNEGDAHRIARQSLVNAMSAVDIEAVFQSARTHAAALIERSGTEADDAGLLDALAFALPVRIVAERVGVSADDSLEASVRRFVACLSPASSPEALRDAHEAAEQLQTRLLALTQRCAPASAFVERMVSGGLERSEQTPNPLVANLLGLFSQTFDATAGLIGNSIVTLARAHRLAEHLIAAPSDIHAFVHEVARYDPAVHNTRRFAREPVEIEGVTLRPGDAVLVVLAAASRDEAVFEHADRFILDRRHDSLPGFGAGRHACPGEAIARAIAAGVTTALVASGFDFSHPALRWTYRPSLNGRIPKFSFAKRNPL